MLTYKPIEDPNHLLTCCDPDPNPSNPGSGDCCYDFWQTDKTSTDAKLKVAIAIANMKSKHLTAITNWYDTLKGWCDDWESADKYADTLCRNLEIFCKHLFKVGEITEKTAAAIEILFCMVKELYTRVDLLKEKYDDINKCIKCLKTPQLESGNLSTCLADYGTKLAAVITTRDDIILKVINAIQLAYELHDNVSDKYGLITVLEYWKGIFKCCEEPADKEHEEADCEGMEHCVLMPMITFPIDKSKYFVNLRKERDETKVKFQEAKKESYDANEKQNAMQALSDGLNNAITSVANSGKCK